MDRYRALKIPMNDVGEYCRYLIDCIYRELINSALTTAIINEKRLKKYVENSILKRRNKYIYDLFYKCM